MLESLGLDTSSKHPRLLTREMIAASDLAIRQGRKENCRFVPGAQYRDWPFEDPKDQDEVTVRRIIVDIDARVREFLRELTPGIELPDSVFGTR